VAERTGQKKLKIPMLDPARMDPEEAGKLWLFQYMIGNSAWALDHKKDEEECCDNLNVMGTDLENSPIYAIPNDFDSSGLVNAHYANPNRSRIMAAAPERVYRGFCVHNSALSAARALYLGKEQELLALVNNDVHLAQAVKDRTVAYLDGFFNELRDPAVFEARIVSNCRN
jgi:hypothetical protein